MTDDLADRAEEARFFSFANLLSWLLTGVGVGVVIVFLALGPEQRSHSTAGFQLIGGLLLVQIGNWLPSWFVDESVQDVRRRRFTRHWSAVVSLAMIVAGIVVAAATIASESESMRPIDWAIAAIIGLQLAGFRLQARVPLHRVRDYAAAAILVAIGAVLAIGSVEALFGVRIQWAYVQFAGLIGAAGGALFWAWRALGAFMDWLSVQNERRSLEKENSHG
jgi:hypothetical protein